MKNTITPTITKNITAIKTHKRTVPITENPPTLTPNAPTISPDFKLDVSTIVYS